MSKFSDSYIKYENFEDSEYERFIIIKKLCDQSNDMAYKWANIYTTIILDYKCKQNDKLLKIYEDCMNIEKIMKKDNFSIENTKNNITYPTEYYIIKKLLPHMDLLNNSDIQMLYNAQKINDGPLFEQLKEIKIPQVFIDLFNKL
jgi:hypothetical protein